jgi:hypothetical protein
MMPVVSVSVLTLCFRYLRVYHWVNTSAGRILVSEGIIRPVVSVSVLILCIIYLRVYHWVDTSAGRPVVYQLRYLPSDKHVDI